MDKRGGAQHLQYTRQNGIGRRDQEGQKNPLVHPASRLRERRQATEQNLTSSAPKKSWQGQLDPHPPPGQKQNQQGNTNPALEGQKRRRRKHHCKNNSSSSGTSRPHVLVTEQTRTLCPTCNDKVVSFTLKQNYGGHM